MKRILPLMLAAAFLLTGCGGGEAPSGGHPSPTPDDIEGPPPPEPVKPTVDLAAFALAQAAYPEFPSCPEPPTDGSGWDAYDEAERQYYDAISQLRADCDPSQVRGAPAVVEFAARSTPLALAGHEGENAVYSPLSLWSALALAAQCANGDSRQQALDALGVTDVGQLRELVRQLWLCLYTEDGRDSLRLGSSIWLNSAAEGSYVQETLDTLARNYFAGVYSVPMGTDAADEAVTEWIFQQTGGLIGGDGPVVETDLSTLALLVSSLYYRVGWQNEFYEGNTFEDTFTNAAGDDSAIDFMHTNRDGLFLLRDGFQAAYLPTRLGEMVFVLPDEGVTPESLLNGPDFLKDLEFIDGRWEHAGPTAAAHWGEVRWSVPKFDVDSNLDLMDALKNLGNTDLTDSEKADLSALTDLPAWLGEAVQMSRVKVDEEGVEAAAVTILTAYATALPPEDSEICVMDLDRPFLFVIRSWDLPLFVGVVNQVG